MSVGNKLIEPLTKAHLYGTMMASEEQFLPTKEQQST